MHIALPAVLREGVAMQADCMFLVPCEGRRSLNQNALQVQFSYAGLAHGSMYLHPLERLCLTAALLIVRQIIACDTVKVYNTCLSILFGHVHTGQCH